MNTDALSKKISGLEKRIEILEKSLIVTRSNNGSKQRPIKKVSAKEFLLSKNLSNAVEKTLALAYYLESIEQVEPFNINDLADVFQTAKEKAPTNLHDMINKNIAKGYLMPVKELKNTKKAWTLTGTGERFIEDESNN